VIKSGKRKKEREKQDCSLRARGRGGSDETRKDQYKRGEETLLKKKKTSVGGKKKVCMQGRGGVNRARASYNGRESKREGIDQKNNQEEKSGQIWVCRRRKTRNRRQQRRGLKWRGIKSGRSEREN